MSVGLKAGCCSEREEPVWGPDGACLMVPGRRRGLVALVPLDELLGDCDVVQYPTLGSVG